MKVRLFILFAITLAVVGAMAFMATSATADGGPHRQRTSLANLTSCGECHRAHTAESGMIVAAASVSDLCLSCHGGSHTNEDVTKGLYNLANSNFVTNAPLKGGGFQSVTMNNGYLTATVPVNVPSTSAHQVMGSMFISYTGGTIWGSGASVSGAGLANFALQCSTCHDPHGGSSGQVDPVTGLRLPTYRILRSDLGAKTGIATSPDYVADSTTKRYYITNVLTSTLPGIYYGQTYPKGGNENTATDNNLMPDISNWCAGCHTRIHASLGSDPANVSSGDPIYDFRHPTDGSNVGFFFDPTKAPNNSPSGGAPGCFTCHVSHGSNSSLLSTRGSALQVPVPGGSETTGPYLDSSLLRLDGRAVCEACHNK